MTGPEVCHEAPQPRLKSTFSEFMAQETKNLICGWLGMWHMQQVQDATRTCCQAAARAAWCRPAPGRHQDQTGSQELQRRIWALILARAGSQRSLDVAEEAAHPISQHSWVGSAKGSQEEVFQSQGTKSEKNGRKWETEEELEHDVKQLNHTQ